MAYTPEQYANDLAGGTTLASAITNGTGTSVSVTSASGMPASGPFRVRCENEIMICTSISGTTLTVTRGAEGTTGVAHSNGVPIYHVVTKDSLRAARQPYGTRIHKAAVQSVTHGSPVVLTYDTSDIDELGAWALSPNPTRLTAPVTGWYHMGMEADFADVAAGKRVINLRINGTTYIAGQSTTAVNGEGPSLSNSIMYNLTASDYVEAVVFQDSSGSLNVNPVSFWMLLL